MCYSALVEAGIRKLNFFYKARVQIDMFDDLFKHRTEQAAARIHVLRALEQSFLDDPKTVVEKRIAQNILSYRESEIADLEAELQIQTVRLAAAERSLLGKVTKKAQNDQRIASNKIAAISAKIAKLQSDELTETDSRIFPGVYAPLIVGEDGESTIQPFRYQLRPYGQDIGFDRKFNGTYNARRDRLEEVYWWKSVFGKQHGALVIKAFYENVKRHDLEHRVLRKGEKEENLILKFEPEALSEMLVPCIWDTNSAESFTLKSFALITDEPNPEVAAAGHDRTPIIMRPEYLDEWLLSHHENLKEYEKIFNDKMPTYFEYAIAA